MILEEFRGLITRKPFGKGSKSEHLAAVLETDQGDLVRRRPSGNPFRDPELEKLLGKTICARGQKIANRLFVPECTAIASKNNS